MSQDITQNKLIYRIKNLEQDINEIHVVLDILEKKFDIFEDKINLLEKQISTLENNITNNIDIDHSQSKSYFGFDNFITSNYDIVE